MNKEALAAEAREALESIDILQKARVAILKECAAKLDSNDRLHTTLLQRYWECIAELNGKTQ